MIRNDFDSCRVSWSWIYLLLAGLVAGVSPVAYGENATCADDAASESAYRKLSRDYREAEEKMRAKLRNGSPEEKNLLATELAALRSEFGLQFLRLAESLAPGEQGFGPLRWVAVYVKEGEALDRAIPILKANYADEDGLWNLLPELELSRSREIDPYLAHLLEHARGDLIRGVAGWVLALRTKYRGERQGDLPLLRQAEALLSRLAKEFGDVQTRQGKLAEVAERELSDLRGPFAIGRSAPGFEAEDLQGRRFVLHDFRGKVVVLSFSGHWCGPCREMHPYERNLFATLAERPFELVEVNSDMDQDALRRRLVETGNAWRHIWDGGGTDGPVTTAWGIRSWPTFFVLDAEGVIRHKAVGAPKEELAAWVGELLPDSGGTPKQKPGANSP